MESSVGLPKLTPSGHSSLGGPLAKYQNQLADKYYLLIAGVRQAAQKSSEATNRKLREKLNAYDERKREITARQQEMIESMGKKLITFDELKSEIAKLGEELVALSVVLRKEAIEIYDKEFQSLQPKIDEAFRACEDFVAQLPANLTRTLEDEVKHLNQEYVSAKQGLVQMLYQQEISARTLCEDTIDQFVQNIDEWKVNRFDALVSAAREKLDPHRPMDYGTIFEDFYRDQRQFTACFRKALQNVSLVAPPDQFGPQNLEAWWNEVENMIELHNNFISQFRDKIQKVIDERNTSNEQLLESLEKELVELKTENDALTALSELLPMQRQGKKMSENYIEKITKYWNNRTAAIRQAFEAVKAFLEPLVEIYTKVVTETKEHDKNVDEQAAALRTNSNEVTQAYEDEIEKNTDEIKVMVSVTEINSRVEACRQILGQIEEEYRKFYEDSIHLFDDQPPQLVSKFEEVETQVLAKLMMTKTVCAQNDWSCSSSRTAQSSARRRVRLATRGSRKRRKESKKDKASQVFSFTCLNESKFEECGTLEIIPEIEGWVDEALNVTPVKGRGRGKLSSARTKSRGKGTGRGRGGKVRLEDYDDVEVPDFVLMETVPQFDDTPSILVYAPCNDEVLEWRNSLRKQLIFALQDFFETEMDHARYEQERQALADELNERLRIHATRINGIELNTAQERVIQVESRKTQLDKHFRKATLFFNKGLKQLEASIEKFKQKTIGDVNKLQAFITALDQQKNDDALVQLNQEFGIESKRCERNFAKDVEQQEKGIEDFTNNFKASNERFMKAILDTSSVCEEEREMCMKFFERMDADVKDINTTLKERIESIKTEFTKNKKKITDEFELMYPRSRTDAQLLDAINAAHKEAKQRLDSLMFHSRQAENGVSLTIKALADAGKVIVDPQTMIDKYFELLENMRMTILQRAKFLSALKSKMVAEPISFKCILSESVKESEKHALETESPLRTRTGRKSSIKIRPDSQSKPTGRMQKKKESVQASMEVLGTMQGQVDNIGNEMVQKLMPMINNYYTQLKQTKTTTTRPDQIPATVNECIERIRSRWRETTTGVPAFLKESAIILGNQVARSTDVAKDTIEKVYDLFTRYYTDSVTMKRDKLQQEFDDALRQLTKERREHRDALKPSLADSNNVAALQELLEEERCRRQRETQIVSDYGDSVYLAEGKSMKMFIEHIPIVTRTFLQMFDSFVLPEDLIEAKIENPRRLTLRELLKEQQRKAANPVSDSTRPFPLKQWPTIMSVMGPMLDVQLSNHTRDDLSSVLLMSGRKGQVRKRKGSERMSQKQLDAKLFASAEKMASQTSLETPIHRNTIITRNQSYSNYETALGERIDGFKAYMASIREENSQFFEHWKLCVKQLKNDLPIPMDEL